MLSAWHAPPLGGAIEESTVLQPTAARGGRRWGRLFGRGAAVAAPGLADEAVCGYARVALELLARWEELHERWLTALDEQRRSERLANAAAVYRWQLNNVR